MDFERFWIIETKFLKALTKFIESDSDYIKRKLWPCLPWHPPGLWPPFLRHKGPLYDDNDYLYSNTKWSKQCKKVIRVLMKIPLAQIGPVRAYRGFRPHRSIKNLTKLGSFNLKSIKLTLLEWPNLVQIRLESTKSDQIRMIPTSKPTQSGWFWPKTRWFQPSNWKHIDRIPASCNHSATCQPCPTTSTLFWV
jgi:hypothetical protein